MSRFTLYIIFLFYSKVVLSYTFGKDSHLYPDETSALRISPYSKISKVRDRSQVAQFNVADFIQKPDEVEKQNMFEDVVQNRPKQLNNYGKLFDSAITSVFKENTGKIRDFAISDVNPENTYHKTLSRNVINDRNPMLTNLDDEIMNYEKNYKHEQQLMDTKMVKDKKCPFKHMKIPFFSHKSQSGKKQKKRKLFYFSCSKKNDNLEITTSNVASKSTTAIRKYFREPQSSEKNHLKRSFREIAYSRMLQQTPGQEIHNSRQYYQQKNNDFETTNSNIDVTSKEHYEEGKSSLEDPTAEDPQYGLNLYSLGRYEKREIDENGKRLKILDDIQRKVDNFQINVPSYSKTSK